MVDFVSKVEEIIKAKELKLGRSPGFGKYKVFFPEYATQHPAKADTNLLEYLILRYTQEGETILDPFCGSGSTVIIGAVHGRNGIGVELEDKFYRWCLEAKEIVEKYETLGRKGSVQFIQGDSRYLHSLLVNSLQANADAILTSPPYSEGIGHDSGENASEEHKERLEMQRKYTRQMTSEGNIASLKHGSIDSIITSPPYAESLEGGSRHTRGGIASRDPALAKSDTYATVMSFGVPVGYSDNPENIGNLKHRDDIDAIITSPPYEKTQSFQDTEFMKRTAKEQIEKLKEGKIRGHSATEEARKRVFERMEKGRIENPENIGNLEYGRKNGRKETYLEAMYKCYIEFYKVLRPGGKAIIIVKPFIKNKKVIDLPYETYLLLNRIGFKLVDVLKFNLERMSFWRLLYYRRFPDVPVIAHEYILVCKKPIEPP